MIGTLSSEAIPDLSSAPMSEARLNQETVIIHNKTMKIRGRKSIPRVTEGSFFHAKAEIDLEWAEHEGLKVEFALLQ